MRLRRDQIAYVTYLSVVGSFVGAVLLGRRLGLSAYWVNCFVAAGFGVQLPLFMSKLPLPKMWSDRISLKEGFALRSLAVLALSFLVGRQIGFLAAMAMLVSGIVSSAFVPLLGEEVR
jgi:hypothetical protein